MSERQKRGRGRPKRPRVESGSSHNIPSTQSFGATNHDTQSASTHDDTGGIGQNAPPSALESRRIVPGPPGFKTEYYPIEFRAPPGKVAIPSLRTYGGAE